MNTYKEMKRTHPLHFEVDAFFSFPYQVRILETKKGENFKGEGTS